MLSLLGPLISCLLAAASTLGHPHTPPSNTNQTQFAGINICGFDFGWYPTPSPSLHVPLPLSQAHVAAGSHTC